MNTKQALLETFARAVKETPAGFFKPVVAAFTTVLEPIQKTQCRPPQALDRVVAINRKKRKK